MTAKPVFSRLLNIDDVPTAGLKKTITATPEECAAIAAEIGLPGIAALTAHLKIAAAPSNRFHVGGEVSATITQVCVVSLDPFDSEVRQPIDITFASVERPMLQDRHSRRVGEDRKRRRDEPPPVAAIVAVEGEEDPPDPIIDGRIDLGIVAVEFLTLSRDLYPRKPGVAFDDVVLDEDDAPAPSAFAALERFKDRS